MLNEDDKIPFTAHLEELRKRLIYCFIAIGIGFAVSYGFKKQLFEILTGPLMTVMPPDGKMIYSHLTEAFFTYLKSALIAGIILASPVILYQFWMFIAPGLYKTERRYLVPIILSSTIFFVFGALFGYFFVFKIGFAFFLGFTTDDIKPFLTMGEYLSFASKLLLAFGIAFELPILITFLAKLGIVSVSFLKKNRKYALLLIFIAAAILTPPDFVSQVLLGIPLYALYELSIIGAVVFGKKEKAEEKVNDIKK